MIKMSPSLLKSKAGMMRARSCLSPLAMACWNEKIPLSIVKLMTYYENYTDDWFYYKTSKCIVFLLHDIEKDVDSGNSIISLSRYEEIKRLFDENNIKYNTTYHNSLKCKDTHDDFIKYNMECPYCNNVA